MKWKRYALLAVIILVSIAEWSFWCLKIKTNSLIVKTYSTEEKTQNYSLVNGEIIEQKFRVQGEYLDKFIVYFEKIIPEATGEITLSLLQGEKIISQWSPQIQDMEDTLFHIVFFYEEGEVKAGNYIIRISAEGIKPNSVAVKTVSNFNHYTWLPPALFPEKNNYKLSVCMDAAVAQKENKGVALVVVFWIVSCMAVTLIFLMAKRIYFKIRICNKRYWPQMVFLIIIALFSVLGIIYSVLIDLLLLILMFLCAYISGKWILRKVEIEQPLICLGVGLCAIGVLVCYIISFGLGNKAVYAIILIVPVVCGYREVINLSKKISQSIQDNLMYAICGSAIAGLYFILGCRPIHSSDALIKHLPISVYASATGQWYDNIIENIVAFSESTLLHYAYTTIMVSFNCFKALSLFSVFLYFFIYLILLRLAENIYPNVNRWLMLITYFSVPYIMMEVVTNFTVDIFPIFIVFTFIMLIKEGEAEKIIERLPVLAFLTGCAVYTKLTILSAVLGLCLFVVGCIAVYLVDGYKGKTFTIRLQKLLKKFPFSLILFVLPFAFSFVKNWYYTGNPFSITAYNEIFNSPYFAQDPFARPFRDNEIGASLKCFYQITFETSKTVEAMDGAMGYLWLLVILIPIGIYIIRKRSLLIWFLGSLFSLQIAGIVVGNLRYIIAILLVIEVLIIISCSAIIDKCPQRIIPGITFLLMIFVLLPNIIFLKENYIWKSLLVPKSDITTCQNVEALKYIPNDAKVLAFNDYEKGLYPGFYFPLSWHNYYIVSELGKSISVAEFVQGFDYALLKKTKEIINEDNLHALEWCKELVQSGVICEEFQTKQYIVYKVKKETNIATMYKEQDVALTADENITVYSDNTNQTRVQFTVKEKLALSLGKQDKDRMDIMEIQEDIPSVIIEVNYYKADDALAGYERLSQKLYPWIDRIDTGWFDKPKDAVKYRVRIFTEYPEEILLEGCQIQGVTTNTLLEQIIADYYERTAILARLH